MATDRLLGGRYRLLERLGAGGMSVVWRGRDEALGRPVAVKLLTAESLAQAGSRERIRTEARAAARLSHPHITSVYDYGQARTGAGPPTPYVVMELLSGSTLADRLRAGPLPVRTALQLCAQVASALAAAHGSGLVHRDVKPGNVMLTPTGAKVLDFGLAAAAGAPDESSSDGQVWGTPAYLAPERLTAGRVEPASDVYALGLLLYAALTGARPWRADGVPQLLHAHRFEPPAPLPALPGLPEPVVRLCHGCLAKEAADRPAAHQAARVLAEAVGWRVSAAVPPRTAAVPDRLAAVYTRRLGGGERPLIRVAAPAEVTVAADGSGIGPIGDGEPAAPGGRTGIGRWRSMALAASAAAVLGSLSAGLWLADEAPAPLGLAGPGAAGLGSATPTAPDPAGTDPAGTDPAGGDPAGTDLAGGDLAGTDPAGTGPAGGGGGAGTGPTAGAGSTAAPTTGPAPTGSPGPAASVTPPPTPPASSGPGSPAPSGSPSPDQPSDDPSDDPAGDPSDDPPESPASPVPSAAASSTLTP